jgi:hypothetical protein
LPGGGRIAKTASATDQAPQPGAASTNQEKTTKK